MIRYIIKYYVLKNFDLRNLNTYPIIKTYQLCTKIKVQLILHNLLQV